MVAQCCALSQTAGICPEMPLADAQAVLGCTDLWVQPFEPERDRQALEALARWATRFSPVVAVDAPDGLRMDVTGCERLFGGHASLLDRVAKEVGRLSLRGRVAIAPTLGCAWAVARFGDRDHVIVSDEGVRAALRPLPIRALRVDTDIEEALAEIGIHKIDQLFDLPRSSLPSRFGMALLVRLDQALGRMTEVLQPVQVHSQPRVHHFFEGFVTQSEVMATVTQQLLVTLCQRLWQQVCGARQVAVEIERVDLQPVRIVITLSGPSRDHNHWWVLIRPKLEKVNLGFGVESIAILATQTDPLPPQQQQLGWFDPSTHSTVHDRSITQTLDVLTNRLGHHQVTYVQPVASHLPEQSLCHQSVLRPAAKRVDHALAHWIHRPSILLDRAKPIEVMTMTPDGPLLWLCGDDGRRRVIHSLGPERIAHSWWQSSPKDHHATRDYFKVQDEQGCWLWIYRDLSSGQWFMHGQWA